MKSLTPFNIKIIAIGLTVAISVLLSIFAIYVMGTYGIAIFVLLPFFIGVSPILICYYYSYYLSKKESYTLMLISSLMVSFTLILCAIEGLICIIMAAPFAFLLCFLGVFITHSYIKSNPNNSVNSFLILIFSITTMSFVDKKITSNLDSVVTEIEINAKPEVVWKNVVEFPQLKEPSEFIFKTGIAYPINAKIVGKGKGAIRYCNFTTGSFVEPITEWNQPKFLKFDVLEQPAPMKELNFWDVKAPHLHDYFVSKKGQFELIDLKNGKTLLRGTTWYYHNIQPAFYWKLWSQMIIHKIHLRVLKHIKNNSDNYISNK